MARSPSLDYAPAGVPVREDLQRSHRELLLHLARPGRWWSAAERLAIAAESRNALACELCDRRRDALSPSAVSGAHASLGRLDGPLLDLTHRLRRDPGRLSRSWYEELGAKGLEEGPYVEAVGVITLLAGVDAFARALGLEPFPLPPPVAGEPSRQRPASARSGTAWVAMIDPADADGPEADLYGEADFVPNIARALSLVPEHVRMLRRLSESHYMDFAEIPDPRRRRDLDRLQIELVASRVSALNECFY